MKVNQRILILCEGVTEYYYARALQQELPRSLQRSVLIEIDYSTRNDPKNLANEAVKRAMKAKKERNPYDKIWLFFDHDNSPHLPEAFKIIRENGFQYAYSAVCLEHWFILHFEDCGKPFRDAHQTIDHLKKFWPEYNKTKSKPFEHLRQRLNDAKKRADILMKNKDQTGAIDKFNPCFTITNLISFFESIKNQSLK